MIMLEYEISGTVQQGGLAKVSANHTEVAFDATSGRDNKLPNPATHLAVLVCWKELSVL